MFTFGFLFYTMRIQWQWTILIEKKLYNTGQQGLNVLWLLLQQVMQQWFWQNDLILLRKLNYFYLRIAIILVMSYCFISALCLHALLCLCWKLCVSSDANKKEFGAIVVSSTDKASVSSPVHFCFNYTYSWLHEPSYGASKSHWEKPA